MTENFEQYLQEVHARDYHGLDDDMPDAFDVFIENLDVAETIEYAEKWGRKIADLKNRKLMIELASKPEGEIIINGVIFVPKNQ